MPLIRSGAELGGVSRKAKELSEEAFVRFDAGETLTPDEKKNLRLASMQFEGMAAFDSKAFGAFFGAGKCYFILEEYERAANRFEHAATGAPLSDPAGKATAAEAKYLASICYERLNNFVLAADSAKTAVDLVPIAAQYHSQWASAELQLNNEKEARKHLAEALKLNPEDKRALQLQRFLKALDK